MFGFDGSSLNLLLIKRGLDPFKDKWALPGGFLKMDETADQGALRELQEETGVKDIYIEQLQAFTAVDRDPRERVLTIAFLAFVRQENYELIAGDDAAHRRHRVGFGVGVAVGAFVGVFVGTGVLVGFGVGVAI